jgi:hypothetical protein
MFSAAAAASFAALPPGWILAGSAPQNYSVTVDKAVTYREHPAACLRSEVKKAAKFGTLMQSVTAERYKGKRVRLSGYVKSDQVTSWAGLWMRADAEKTTLAFDNMQNRAIRGSTDWTRYDVVLDIPNTATSVYFGVLLDGTGAVWVAQFALEVVDASVPVTSVGPSALPLEPVNLGFEN